MPEKCVIEDVLAARYATPEMTLIWSPTHRVVAERQLWIAVLRAQDKLGVMTPDGAIKAYETVADQVDLASIEARERRSRHDVQARIEEFNTLAGFQVIHRGMTSRDLTDNVEQLLILQSLLLIRDRAVAMVARLAASALEYCHFPIAGRSHNVVAQVTTLGKRFASAGEELLQSFDHLIRFIDHYPLRGIKGPMGTAQDQLDLLNSNTEALRTLEQQIAEHLGFSTTLNSIGQIYPRSLDYMTLAILANVAAAPSSFATTLRLMAGYELVTEGFGEGQVGSSAMPHKMNARTSERICGLNLVLHGFVAMIAPLSGSQWQEGDVSCSVVRRVALPQAFFALDGLIESFLTVMLEFGTYPAVIDRELTRYLPFLATTKLLVACMRVGVSRAVAYEAIQSHAKAAALRMRQQGSDENDLYDRLGADERIPLTTSEIANLIGRPIEFTGDATAQVARFCDRAATITSTWPEAAAYHPNPIL